MESMLITATVIALGLGTVMAFIAWRLLRQDGDRRAARVEALQALSGAPVAPIEPGELDYQYSDPIEVQPTLFATPERMPARRLSARLAVVLAIAACAALPYGLYTIGAFEAIATAASSDGAAPIELLSLRHTTDDVGGFTVTGLVQNPPGGRRAKGVIAVVYLFDDGGRIIGTGRAPIDLAMFQPGEESTFVVSIPKTAGIGKYRVGFRLADGGIVSHVDRRGQPPVETTEDAVGPDRSHPVPGPLPSSGRSEGE
jgi:hypothetical protein